MCSRFVDIFGDLAPVRFRLPLLGALLLISTLATSAGAQDGAREVSIHGFGGWAVGDTDGNRYLAGSEDTEFENVSFSLSLSSSPAERMRISSQIELATDPTGEDEVEVELDYAFAEWSFSDNLHGRIGRSKHPFGIYAEFFDVGTLRPFFDLPQGMYGPSGIAGESYDGVGLTGNKRFGSGWSLDYDVYVGSLRFEAFEPWDGLRDEEGDDAGDDEDEELFEIKERDEVLGLRVAFSTPFEGLSFGLSAYSGMAIEDEGMVEEEVRHTGYGVHFEYIFDGWTVRAEAARIDEEEEVETDAAYVEVAYSINQKWQLVGRYDTSDSDVLEVDLGDVPTIAEHDDLAFGVNYWFSQELVLKLAIHQVEGNRFALPDEVDEAVDTGDFDDETTLVSFGAQFSF